MGQCPQDELNASDVQKNCSYLILQQKTDEFGYTLNCVCALCKMKCLTETKLIRKFTDLSCLPWIQWCCKSHYGSYFRKCKYLTFWKWSFICLNCFILIVFETQTMDTFIMFVICFLFSYLIVSFLFFFWYADNTRPSAAATQRWLPIGWSPWRWGVRPYTTETNEWTLCVLPSTDQLCHSMRLLVWTAAETWVLRINTLSV